MNSEELELSLRAEFESYLKGFLAELRQEASEFQKNFETEFEKHKSQTDEAVRKLVQRFETGVQFGEAFNESVIEHLRLARDEGATLTAVAIGEAEKLKEASAPVAEFDKLRDAINEISSKTSQSEILKALVDSASAFAPRGVFFIVKNEHFVGWRAFGDEAAVDEATVRELQFPMSEDTVLADAIGSLGTTSGGAGAHQDNRVFLDALHFGNPDRMYAIPLVARGRGVAVLYADYGDEGVVLNPEALETLVRVAGLTVELAAAAVQPAAVPQHVESQPVSAEDYAEEPVHDVEEPFQEEEHTVEEPVHEEVEEPGQEEVQPEETPVAEFEQTEHPAEEYDYDSPGYQTPLDDQPAYGETPIPVEIVEEYEAPAAFDEAPAEFEETQFEVQHPVEVVEDQSSEVVSEVFAEEDAVVEHEPVAEVEPAVEEPPAFERFSPVEEVTYFEPVEEPQVVETVETSVVYDETPAEVVEEEFPEVIGEQAAEPAAEYSPQPDHSFESGNGSPAPAPAEPWAEVASAQVERTRYRDRNVDLPIEVPEGERRLHNDARRFARLLVSEIKLYNEQKVADGRSSGDLYDRLREAIDRSRDMYDKRVQQPVADKFDYFHFELVNSLAEGEDVKLGASYPGSKVPA